mmetsp:Transcript_2997/g.5857  ORF Transcript_2997/g.5857 Transcript_2997/m.5857 type:complete len:190 (-) Transcript_2997:819-1388(-)
MPALALLLGFSALASAALHAVPAHGTSPKRNVLSGPACYLSGGLVSTSWSHRQRQGSLKMCSSDPPERPMPNQNGISLESQFAAEVLRRSNTQESSSSTGVNPKPGEPDGPATAAASEEIARVQFQGAREIILRKGEPVSVPRRPPPTPLEMEESIRGRISTSGLLLGGTLTVCTLFLLISIGMADASA